MTGRQLRGVFDEDADRYDRARPGYPTALFGDLARTADVGPGSRVLEVGPGTGQATGALGAACGGRGGPVAAVRVGGQAPPRAGRHLLHGGLPGRPEHLLQPPRARCPPAPGLLTRIGAVADERYGGQITKRYLYELRVARRA